MFTRSAAIRQVIYDFIRELRNEYREGKSIHGMRLDLEAYLEDGHLNRSWLEHDILARLATFNKLSTRLKGEG